MRVYAVYWLGERYAILLGSTIVRVHRRRGDEFAVQTVIAHHAFEVEAGLEVSSSNISSYIACVNPKAFIADSKVSVQDSSSYQLRFP